MSKFSQLAGSALLMLAVAASSVSAQAPAVAPAAPAAPAAKKLIPPEDITLATVDGVALRATYYASNVGKEAVPVILIHAGKGSRGDFASLAAQLQKIGHAVIVPDLRGHGESTQQKNPQTLKDVDLNPTRFVKQDYANMIKFDMERLKDFLRDKNNAGELNMEKLCVVGVEMGATVAINWAALDWAWPVLATGKQGQDVKALVLISPSWSLPGGFVFSEALTSKAVQSQMSVMIVVGEQNSKSMKDAERLQQSFARHHPEPPAGEEAEKKDLFLIPLKTSLTGSKILSEPSLELNKIVAQFIELRLVKKQYPWAERKTGI